MIDSSSRREFLRNSAVSLAAIATGVWIRSSEGSDAPASRPNIVFILIDDFGWKDLGCYGSEFYETPNVDAFATQGVRFTQAYAEPVCSPTRASFLTGKSPARVHMTDWLPGWQARRGGPQPSEEFIVPKMAGNLDGEVTIAEAMRRGGYVTGVFGKWHVGGKPDAYGFDYVKTAERDPNDPKGVQQLTRMACDFMKDNRTKPFFLFMSHDAVHTPIEATPDLMKKYKEKRPGEHQKSPEYAALVEYMDTGVGTLLKAIDELGLSANTIVFFAGDNGGFHGYTSQYPLRNAKGTLYEGGIRVPVIVRLPQGVKKNVVCDTPIMVCDFYPTLLELAGLKSMPEQHRDGVSIVPLLTGKGSLPERNLFWHYPHYHRGKPGGAIRKGNYKLIEYFHLEGNTVELYDLAADMSESRDLAAEQPKVAEGLQQELRQWRVSVGAQTLTPNPNYKPKNNANNKSDKNSKNKKNKNKEKS